MHINKWKRYDRGERINETGNETKTVDAESSILDDCKRQSGFVACLYINTKVTHELQFNTVTFQMSNGRLYALDYTRDKIVISEIS